MKAVCIPAPGTIEIIDVAVPSPGPEDLLLEVHYVGLCGSDLGMYHGTFAIGSYPRIPGHEVSAVIMAKGEAVPDSLQEGDRVTLAPYSECGICPACRTGRQNCCQYNQTLGLQRDGAMSNRFVTHYSRVTASQQLSLKELALVEPLSVGYHAANRGRVTETDSVLVLGCGTIGIGVVAAAVRKGATVIAVDIDDSKLAQAQRFGAHHAVNSTRQDVMAASSELTGGEGVSVAIEAVGLPETFRLAVEAVAFAGRVVYVGYAKKDVCYDTNHFVRKELDILGSRNALRVFPAVVKMMETGDSPFLELVTRVYPFEGAPRAFRDWDASPGNVTKILIDVATAS
ncbi:zinc-binding alcohol dehydrogenase family protein [Chloroflexota bacterium]